VASEMDVSDYVLLYCARQAAVDYARKGSAVRVPGQGGRAYDREAKAKFWPPSAAARVAYGQAFEAELTRRLR
jgi:hypothetical protein